MCIVAAHLTFYDRCVDDLLAAVAVLTIMIALDVLALRFGVSSRDGSRETWW